MGKAKYRVVAALAAAAACCLGAGVMAVSADAGDVVAVPTAAFYETNFENETGDPWNNSWWGNASVGWETEAPLAGQRSVKSEGTGNGGGLLLLTLNTDDVVPEVGHTYRFEFKLKIEGFTSVKIISNYGDYGEAAYDGQAWTAPAAFIGMNAEEVNGFYSISYEKSITSIGFGGNFNLMSIFAYEGEGKIVLDDFVMKDTDSKENAYYSVQYDGDFESEGEGNVWDVTPFWANTDISLGWETEEPLAGERSLLYEGSGLDNYQIGGITISKLTTKPDKNYYYDYKINVEGFSKVVIVTLDNAGVNNGSNDYTEINYDNGRWTASGLNNFTAEDTGTYYRLRYNHATSALAEDDFKIYATGTGRIVIDDFICAYEDNSPSADRTQATFNVYAPADVVFGIELKEEAFVAVKIGGETLAQGEDYTFEEGTLTLRQSLFADKTGSVAVTVESAAGTLGLTVDIVEEKIAVSVSGLTAENKTYDGSVSAVVNTENAVLGGVMPDDDVKLIVGSAAFDNASAGKDKTVTAAGLSLTGADAEKYELTVAELTFKAEILPKTLEIPADAVSVADKTYDGEASAFASVDAAKVSGVVAGDDVSFAATAVFADKNAGENKSVTVSGFVLSGEDAQNYAVADESVEKSASILKKKITVTADDVTVKQGETGALTYRAEGLAEGDTLSGSLSREAGDKAGTYAITLGTLSNPNYEIEFVGGTYTIEKAGCGCNSAAVAESAAAGIVLAAAALFAALKRKKSAR